MIVTRLIGGLGNQMFQYACGRALAEKNGQRLTLDVRGFSEQKLRRFVLNHYQIQADIADDNDLPSIPHIRSPFVRLFPRWYRPRGLRIIRDYHYGRYEPRVFSSGSDVYLDGYWQTERYFMDTAETIKKELRLTAGLDPENQRVIEHIGQQPSVSVHVRRTDYTNNNFYAHCSLEYYQRGIEYISSRQTNVHLYVFSDDPGWVQKNLKTNLPTTYVTHNLGVADYKDLALMSQCQHHIIANSSFSWWGAWLGRDPAGIVIAPDAWYTDPAQDARDILPAGWVRQQP